MLGVLLKQATYYILWKKFQKHIKVLAISIALLVAISYLYQDLYGVIKLSNKENLIWLTFGKWVVYCLIILFNIWWFKRIKVDMNEFQASVKSTKKLDPQMETIRVKDELLTKTDLILNKYQNA